MDMPCYHPLKAFIVGKNDKGNNDLIITSYDVKYLSKDKYSSKYFRHHESYCANALNCGEKLCTYDNSCFRPAWIPNSVSRDVDGNAVWRDEKVFYRFFTIPCGQCIGCRIDYSKQWATRMILENQYSSSSCFVTLTYNDEFVPHSEYFDKETGELFDCLTLRKRDLVLFNKRLRKAYGDGIRFYACGEYGSNTFRPHYHSIYFNLNVTDKKFFRMSADGKFKYYTSPTIEKLWGKGNVLIADVSFETCAYVARYVTKKYKGEKNVYSDLNIEPVFSLMSRRPGIGKQWFDDNWKKVYDTYIITVSTSKGGLRFKPPRYYDMLFDGLDSVRMAQIKVNQTDKALNLTRLKLDNTDYGLLEMLAAEEYNFKHSPKTGSLLIREEL